jgi:uncharacterized protein (DUF2461 family)
MPRGFQNYAQERFAEWLKLSSFVAVSHLEGSQCTTPDLLKRVVDFAAAVKPLLEFGWNVEDRATTRPRNELW